MANFLDTQHISNHLEDYEVARTGFFTLIVDNLDGIRKYTFNPETGEPQDSDVYAKAQEYLMLSVVKATVPQPSIEADSIRRGNEVIKYAKTVSWPEGSITINDYVGIDTKGILMAWWNLAYNVHTRKGGYMKDYKKKCTLIEYTQAHEQVRKWTLEGCWISDVKEDDFDVENDGKRALTATLQYDRAVMDTDASEVITTTVER